MRKRTALLLAAMLLLLTVIPASAAGLKPAAHAGADPKLLSKRTIYVGKDIVKEYSRSEGIDMPEGDAYLPLPFGVATFRGDAFRRNAASGSLPGTITAMEVVWAAEVGSVKSATGKKYGGVVSQPLIVKWDRDVRQASGLLNDQGSITALKEVIVAGMDGKVYFLNLTDGEMTREPLNIGYPIAATPSLHAAGYPLLAVGQHIRKMENGTGSVGQHLIDLMTMQEVGFINGLDGSYNRPYNNESGAFETSPLFDRNTDTLISVGDNGMLYTQKLYTLYDHYKGSLRIAPDPDVCLVSRNAKQNKNAVAVASSPAMLQNLCYIADVTGYIRCIDTDTMAVAWAYAMKDKVTAALALDGAEGAYSLYACELLTGGTKGSRGVACFDAMSGEMRWKTVFDLIKGQKTVYQPGVAASPVIGEKELSDRIIVTVTGLQKSGAEKLRLEGSTTAAAVALSKMDGSILWTAALDAEAVSSPVAVYDETGRGYILQADSEGMLYLLDGLTGGVITRIHLGGTVEGSPAVYNDMLVIGTTGAAGGRIIGVKLQ